MSQFERFQERTAREANTFAVWYVLPLLVGFAVYFAWDYLRLFFNF